jgi:hypothetical protein
MKYLLAACCVGAGVATVAAFLISPFHHIGFWQFLFFLQEPYFYLHWAALGTYLGALWAVFS